MTTFTLFPIPRRRFSAIFGVFALSSAVMLPAQAEITQCTEIASLPATLTTQGIYCLKKDLATQMVSGNAITIANNNITIDFNGFKLGGATAGSGTQTIGVYSLDRRNIVLRNGLIRGFYRGISLQDNDIDYSNTGNYELYDLTLDYNRHEAVWLEGNGNSIHNIRVNHTGGAIDPNATGILNFGANGNISDNFVSETIAKTGGIANGIVSSGGATAIRNNVISDTRVGALGRGIRVNGPWTSIEGNAILNTAVVAGSTGISTDSATLNQCSNNKIGGFATAIDSCLDGGGNIDF